MHFESGPIKNKIYLGDLTKAVISSCLLLLQCLKVWWVRDVFVVVHILRHLCWGEQCCVQLLADSFLTHAGTNEHNLLPPAAQQKQTEAKACQNYPRR